MKHPKFILTKDGTLRFGMVNLHEDLLQVGDRCLGGGYYEIDPMGYRLLLDRESYDFGPPRWDMVDSLRLPSDYRGLKVIYRHIDGTTLTLDEQFNIYYY